MLCWRQIDETTPEIGVLERHGSAKSPERCLGDRHRDIPRVAGDNRPTCHTPDRRAFAWVRGDRTSNLQKLFEGMDVVAERVERRQEHDPDFRGGLARDI